MDTDKKTVLLIGETGTGKSSFGNMLLGRDEFNVSDEEESCTSETLIKTSSLDPSIEVIDTPGLLDTHLRDQANTQQMVDYIKHLQENENNNLHLVIVVLNFFCKRLNSEIQNMIKFLCNVFPINFSHHIAIVFTRYIESDEQRKAKGKKNPKQIAKEKFVPKLMSIISFTNNEKQNFDPPVFFLDSYEQDEHSKNELTRLIQFIKILPPIELIRRCNSKYKDIIDIEETETHEEKEGDKIYVVEKKYKKRKYTDYNGNVTYGERTLFSENKKEKNKELPKKKEKEFSEYVKEFIDDCYHTYQGIKVANEINKAENYSLNMIEKIGIACLGAHISEKNSKKEINK